VYSPGVSKGVGLNSWSRHVVFADFQRAFVKILQPRLAQNALICAAVRDRPATRRPGPHGAQNLTAGVEALELTRSPAAK
jgi:hypothetical protein